MSTSGTLLVFALDVGGLTRRRSNPHSAHGWDGFPLMFQEPCFATSCGCGDISGYRSTPALLVVAAEDSDGEVGIVYEEALVTARRLVADGHDFAAMPVAHPDEPCGAMYCAFMSRARIR